MSIKHYDRVSQEGISDWKSTDAATAVRIALEIKAGKYKISRLGYYKAVLKGTIKAALHSFANKIVMTDTESYVMRNHIAYTRKKKCIKIMKRKD